MMTDCVERLVDVRVDLSRDEQVTSPSFVRRDDTTFLDSTPLASQSYSYFKAFTPLEGLRLFVPSCIKSMELFRFHFRQLKIEMFLGYVATQLSPMRMRQSPMRMRHPQIKYHRERAHWVELEYLINNKE